MASPAKQALLENDQAVKPEGLGDRCYTFSSSDGQRTVVAFWEAKPWEGKGLTSEAEITLPTLHEPSHVLVYELLSGNQIEVPWKRSEDNRIFIKVSISGAPKLLMTRS